MSGVPVPDKKDIRESVEKKKSTEEEIKTITSDANENRSEFHRLK